MHDSPWPSGWRRVPLSEAGQWLSGGTPSTSNDDYWGGDIPWISAASLKSLHVSDSERRLTRSGALNGSRLVDAGTILFIVRGMSLKSEFRIGVTTRQVAFGQDCKALIPHDGIDPHFLAYAIRAQTYRILAMVEETSHGTGRLDTRRLESLVVGVPPLAEQRQIVAAHSAFERRIEKIHKLCVKLHALDLHANAGLCEGKEVRLGELLKRIEVGSGEYTSNASPGEHDWGALRLSAVTLGEFTAGNAKKITLCDSRRKLFEVHDGDIVMIRVNGAQPLVGLTRQVLHPHPRMTLSDLMYRLVPDPNRLDSKFLSLLLNSPEMRQQIRRKIRGSSGQYQLPQSEAMDLGVIVPPLSDQRQVVASVTSVERRTASLAREIAMLRSVQAGVTQNLLSGQDYATVQS